MTSMEVTGSLALRKSDLIRPIEHLTELLILALCTIPCQELEGKERTE